MAGQHRDVLSERQAISTLTYEECIEIAREKAGALMRLACLMGALAAGASDEQCTLFASLGTDLGISHQLDNDAHDLQRLLPLLGNDQQSEALAQQEMKTDILRGKKTLPIFFAAQKGITLSQSKDAVDMLTMEQIRILHASSVKAWGICLLYRERVRTSLQEIAKQHLIPQALYFLLRMNE